MEGQSPLVIRIMAKQNQIGFQIGAKPANLPEEEITDIVKAVERLFLPAHDIASSDIQLTNDMLQEIIESSIGETFTISEMIIELEQAGYKQAVAGNNLYWCLKRKV